jgi:hypothetical protein
MFFPAERPSIVDATQASTDVAPSGADEPDADLRCPRCATPLVPSRRRGWDWIMHTLSRRRPFRCTSCHTRAWRHLPARPFMRPGTSALLRQ